MSSAVIRMALAHPAIRRKSPLFQAPIRRRELVKCKSGNMANGSCNAKTTWLRVRRSLTLASPLAPIIKIAGIIASARVINLRNQG